MVFTAVVLVFSRFLIFSTASIASSTGFPVIKSSATVKPISEIVSARILEPPVLGINASLKSAPTGVAMEAVPPCGNLI